MGRYSPPIFQRRLGLRCFWTFLVRTNLVLFLFFLLADEKDAIVEFRFARTLSAYVLSIAVTVPQSEAIVDTVRVDTHESFHNIG